MSILIKNKACYKEQENIFRTEIKSRKILVKYVIDVLEDSDEMLDSWQHSVKQA